MNAKKERQAKWEPFLEIQTWKWQRETRLELESPIPFPSTGNSIVDCIFLHLRRPRYVRSREQKKAYPKRDILSVAFGESFEFRDLFDDAETLIKNLGEILLRSLIEGDKDTERKLTKARAWCNFLFDRTWAPESKAKVHVIINSIPKPWPKVFVEMQRQLVQALKKQNIPPINGDDDWREIKRWLGYPERDYGGAKKREIAGAPIVIDLKALFG